MMERVKVGCCGFPRGMKHYFSQFKVVEVQQTFYKLPSLREMASDKESYVLFNNITMYDDALRFTRQPQ